MLQVYVLGRMDKKLRASVPLQNVLSDVLLEENSLVGWGKNWV